MNPPALPGRPPPMAWRVTGVAAMGSPASPAAAPATTLRGLGPPPLPKRPPILRLVDIETGEAFDSREAVIRVGRAKGSFPFMEPSEARSVFRVPISKKQAALTRREGRICLTDSSTYGTYVNGEKVTQNTPTEILPGDLLRFGPDPAMPSYLVILPESPEAPPAVDYALVMSRVEREIRRRISGLDPGLVDPKIFNTKQIEWTKRREGLKLLLDHSEPFYRGLAPRAEGLARLYDAFFYLKSACPKFHWYMRLALFQNGAGQPALALTFIDLFASIETYIIDPERNIWNVELAKRRWPFNQRWVEEYHQLIDSGERISPRIIKAMIEEETGYHYLPHPLAFANIDHLVFPAPGSG